MEWIEKSAKLPIKSWCSQIDEKALNQAYDLSNHPRCRNHIALMPDCHPGYGMPIGGVIACDNALIPYGVGVDIGCGMIALQTDMDSDKIAHNENLDKLFSILIEKIPIGEGRSHQTPQNWNLLEDFASSGTDPWLDDESLEKDLKNLGTLGGGNHFLEVQQDRDRKIWLMIHTGSRNLGYRIANWFHKIACDRNYYGDLSWLDADSSEGEAYIEAMSLAMSYAMENRSRILKIFKNSVKEVFGSFISDDPINIHHNYASYETIDGKGLWVHRKGATSALPGQKGIIPGSMGTKSFIVEGLGNHESFQSCSHGAGRVLSRNEANKKLTVHQCDKDMEGVYHNPWRKNKRAKKGVDLSEAPKAYKNIIEVMAQQEDLVKIITELTPIAVLKG